MAERLAVINAAKPGELRLRATFNAASVCYGAEKAIDGLRLEYRKLASEPGFFAKLFGASCSDWTAALRTTAAPSCILRKTPNTRSA